MRGLHEAGHRVVVVMATDGGAGLSDEAHASNLAELRRAELATSAKVLGVAQTYWLGYQDSGLHAEVQSGNTFANCDLEQAAAKLTEILESESATVVVGYDARGGYGHPDHVQVHRLVRKVAEVSGVPVVLEATLDRQAIAHLADRFSPITRRLPAADLESLVNGFSARADIAYTVDVRRWISPKRASMRAHASQQTGGSAPRTLAILVKVPRLIFRAGLGREWFVAVRENAANPIAKLPQR